MVTIFSPGNSDNKLAHGVVLFPLKGRLYAQWQTSERDEDGKNTRMLYSVNDQGETWSAPQQPAPSLDAGIRTSGGWWSDAEALITYINVWPAGLVASCKTCHTTIHQSLGKSNPAGF